jgi:hypothetical protein
MMFEGRQAYITLDELVDAHATPIESCGNVVQEYVGVSRGTFGDVNAESDKFYKESKSYVKGEL